VLKRYTEDLYHKPTDEVIPDWDPGGQVEDAQLLFAVGCRVAQADRYSAWWATSSRRSATRS
jgi:hypothetical protein